MASKAMSRKTTRKLKALEEVAGLLSDLSPAELETLLEATRRRPLFEKSPYVSSRHKHPHRALKK